MGGMFTLLKVRSELPVGGADPGWYEAPPGTLAQVAPEADLRRDGIELPNDLPPRASVGGIPEDEAWCGPLPPAKTPTLAKNHVTARIKFQ